jgi:hypothetical protein
MKGKGGLNPHNTSDYQVSANRFTRFFAPALSRLKLVRMNRPDVKGGATCFFKTFKIPRQFFIFNEMVSQRRYIMPAPLQIPSCFRKLHQPGS